MISAAKSANALYFDSIDDLDTTFCFLEDQETKVSPRKTQCPAIYFLSSMIVAQSTSEKPVMSRSIDSLICRQ